MLIYLDKYALFGKKNFASGILRLQKPTKNVSYYSKKCFISTFESWHFLGKSWHILVQKAQIEKRMPDSDSSGPVYRPMLTSWNSVLWVPLRGAQFVESPLHGCPLRVGHFVERTLCVEHFVEEYKY